MPVVRMPNGDQVNFPDDWSKDRIQANIKEKFPEASARDVPRGGYVGQTLKGAAQSYAGLADLALTGGDITRDVLGPTANIIPGLGGAAATLSSIIPSDWRKQLTEFADQPYTPGYETAGRIGYFGAPLAGPAKLTQGGIKAGAKFVKANPEALPQAARVAKGMAADAATGVVGNMAIDHFLGHLPFGLGYVLPVIVKHYVGKALKGSGTKAAEEVGEAAVKGPDKGGLPSTLERDAARFRSPEMKAWKEKWAPQVEEFKKSMEPPPAKPRVRVPAQTRQVPEQYNFGKAREDAGD